MARSTVMMGALLAAAAQGCLAPTLPIPPPSDPNVMAVGDGTVRVSGGKGSASPDAIVIVINETLHDVCPSGCRATEADIAAGDGSWGVVLVGKVGDSLSIVQITHEGASSTLDVMVR